MEEYTQLSQVNRYQIKALLDAGLNQTQIAGNIGVHRLTISRELNRNIAPVIARQAEATARRPPSASPTNPNAAGSAKPRRENVSGKDTDSETDYRWNGYTMKLF